MRYYERRGRGGEECSRYPTFFLLKKIGFEPRPEGMFRGHVDLLLQWHGFVFGALFFINFLLCEMIMLDIFSVKKYLTFTAFLLHILSSLLDYGKGWPNKFRKLFGRLVMTFWLHGGLNQMFRLLLCFSLFSLVSV